MKYLRKFFNDEDRMSAVLNIRNTIIRKHVKFEELIIRFFKFVEKNKKLKKLFSRQNE